MKKLQVAKQIDELYKLKLLMPTATRTADLFDLLKSTKDGDSLSDILASAIVGIHLINEYQKNFVMSRRSVDTLINATSERMLLLNQVDPKEMAPLQATYYLILSKVEKNHGNFWNALNFRTFSFELDKNNQPYGEANSLIALGNSHLQAGFGPAAIASFTSAANLAIGYLHDLSTLMLAKTYRLCDELHLAKATLIKLQKNCSLDKSIAVESQWEGLCLKTQESGRINNLLKAVSPKGSHREPSYILEAKLWSFCKPQSLTPYALPKISSMKKKKCFELSTTGPLYKILIALEEAYDEVRPLASRMEKLSAALERTNSLRLVEHAQLFLVASSSWFHKKKLFSSASTCILKYEQISISLTNGKSRDHLNLSPLYIKKSWYKSQSKLNEQQKSA